MTGTPEWLMQATQHVFMTAAMASCEPDHLSGREHLLEALKDFARHAYDECGDNEMLLEQAYFALAMTLAGMAVALSPADAFGEGDGPTVAVLQDTVTGEIVDDPDQEVFTPGDAGALAAMRLIAAKADNNDDLAADIFFAAAMSEDAEQVMAFLFILAEVAGGVAADHAHGEGRLEGDPLAGYLARKAAEEGEARPEPERRVSAAGIEYVSLPLQTEPQGSAVVAPHGSARYGTSTYHAGIDGSREEAIAGVHAEIRSGMALDGGRPPSDLCGVEHAEDVQVWQMPKEVQPSLNRYLRKLKRMTGRTALVVRCWQHLGPCEQAEAAS